MTNQNLLITALYECLSRDDDLEGESNSIVNQKLYLQNYADEHGFTNCKHYTDDGFSGGNFERPGWKRMLADIEADKIDTVLVKDMSRVGRNYLQTGFYTEVYFKKKAIHFISIDSHVDSARSDNIEFVPMLNVLNEMYLRDQSRKVVIGYHAKGMTGVPIMSKPCFGYVKDPEDRNRWLVEPQAAEIVRRIFELAAEETNPYRITRILQSEKRMTPSAYFESQGLHTRTGKKSVITGPYDWNRASILNILNAQEYLGRTVNFKSGKASYQAKRKANLAEKQAVFEHTHEAIIDLDTWNKAHSFLSSRRQTQPFTQWPTSPFKGKVVCAKCGAIMYNIRCNETKKDGSIRKRDYFICSTFNNTSRQEKRGCIQNKLNADDLRELLKAILQAVCQKAAIDRKAFAQKLRLALSHQPNQAAVIQKDAAVKRKRMNELDRLLKKLYEDYALDKISEAQFDVLSAQYEAELDMLEKAVFAQQERLKVFRTDEENIDRFLKPVDEYQHCENYSDEMLAKMIEKVVVHERTKSESGEPIRAMEVYLSFIGRLPMQ